ncbi:MAG TPA: histidine kinase [Methylomirabilota bacterium]|nr:histidine kinase [Methylomirabilota bacterium]
MSGGGSACDARQGPARGYWFRIALVIGAAAVMTTVLRVVWGGGALVSTLTHGVVYSGCIGVLAGLILPPVRHRVTELGRIVEWAATLFALLVVAVGGTFLACGILGLLGYGRGLPLMTRVAASFEMNALITAIVGVAMTLYEGQRARLDALTLELRTKELERERDRKMALEARLSSLESRLHPHFLFNTLNAISELIHENPERAERTVERLAVLLRAALDATGRGTVPLAQELEIVGDYLEIEKTRLGERLTYRFDVAADAGTCEVPPLAVQTLVENSIKHAIAPRPAGGHVHVEAGTSNGRLIVGVWDDGPGFEVSAAIPGHGLENLQGRLAARFGDAATLNVARRDGGTLVTVSVPRSSRA